MHTHLYVHYVYKIVELKKLIKKKLLNVELSTNFNNTNHMPTKKYDRFMVKLYWKPMIFKQFSEKYNLNEIILKITFALILDECRVKIK